MLSHSKSRFVKGVFSEKYVFFSGSFVAPLREDKLSRKRTPTPTGLAWVFLCSFVLLGERTTAVRQYHRQL